VIREATEADIPELLRMGRAFFGATAFGAVGFDEESAAATARMLIKLPNGILLITEGGMAGALVYPFYFNAAHMTAQELFWWVDPDARKGGTGIHLLVALEAAARAKGAQSLTMICLAEIEGPAVAELYLRNGYAPSEQSFIKVI